MGEGYDEGGKGLTIPKQKKTPPTMRPSFVSWGREREHNLPGQDNRTEGKKKDSHQTRGGRAEWGVHISYHSQFQAVGEMEGTGGEEKVE